MSRFVEYTVLDATGEKVGSTTSASAAHALAIAGYDISPGLPAAYTEISVPEDLVRFLDDLDDLDDRDRSVFFRDASQTHDSGYVTIDRDGDVIIVTSSEHTRSGDHG